MGRKRFCPVDGLGAGKPGWLDDPRVRCIPFCPEDHGLGTPRTMPDLHGGDGYAVLDGTAQVLDEHRVDLTERMLDMIDPLIPGLRDHMLLCELGTPLTNEYYVSSHRGNLYGTAKSASQIGPFGFPIKTEIDRKSVV